MAVPDTVTATASTRAPGQARRGHRSGLALAIIAASQLMVVLDATIVNVALPSIQGALHFSTTNLSWVLNAYTLTFGGLLLLGGRAGDILGRRRVFAAGIALFTAASFLGGLATSPGWLLAARAAQGIGAAIASPAALALVVSAFPEGVSRNKAMGLYAAIASGGASLGLVLGGAITQWES
ncbi:MAG TPA: MFS transporter, partial [Mycobacteriales bacterium]|nr:MFS transporter [Mycobacteriales bacterium]